MISAFMKINFSL